MTVTANKLASPVPIFPFQTYFAHYKKTTLVLVSAGGVSIEISVILDDYERRKRAGVGGYLVTLSVGGYFFLRYRVVSPLPRPKPKSGFVWHEN